MNAPLSKETGSGAWLFSTSIRPPAICKARPHPIRQYLLQRSAELECRGYLNMTVLLLAATEGDTEMAAHLVGGRADIHNLWYPEDDKGTALEMAAERGRTARRR